MQNFNPLTYSKELKNAARRDGFTFQAYGTVDRFMLPVLERNVNRKRPTVYISAGVHGNEPAGPLAVLEMLRKGSFPEDVNLILFPMVNPGGLATGTRENREGIDLNRDYGKQPSSVETAAQLKWIGERRFDLGLCLHEDDDGTGFYLYSHITEATEHDFPGLAIEAARPITGIDSRTEIDGMPASGGRMFPPDEVIAGFGDNLPEALCLLKYHGLRYSFTTETPSRLPIQKRVLAQENVIGVILETFLNKT